MIVVNSSRKTQTNLTLGETPGQKRDSLPSTSPGRRDPRSGTVNGYTTVWVPGRPVGASTESVEDGVGVWVRPRVGPCPLCPVQVYDDEVSVVPAPNTFSGSKSFQKRETSRSLRSNLHCLLEICC